MKKFLNTIMCTIIGTRNVIVNLCEILCVKHLLKDTDKNSNKIARMLEKELGYDVRLISFLESHDCKLARRMRYSLRQLIGDELLIEYYDIIYNYKTTALKIYAH